MKEEKKNLPEEQGSVQRQTQKNEDYKDASQNKKYQGNNKFGIVPAPQAKHEKKSDSDTTHDQPDLKDIDDEKIIPGIRAKRSPWNSIDFEADDFFGGLVPA